MHTLRPSIATAGLSASAVRRGLFAAAAGIAAGVAAIGTARPALAAPSDADILNFALNLEYLEAEYYLRAIGRTLAASDVTGVGAVGGVRSFPGPVPFATPFIQQYANEIASDEEAHVKFLRAALGSAAVARPVIDIRQAFTNAARAAGLIGPNDRFNPFENETNFLLGAFVFEDVGVTAYKGAARLIENKDVLEAAAGILAVEAYHAGEIRTVLYGRGIIAPAQAISDLRDAADGPGDRDQGIQRGGVANIVPTDANGLAFSRTTDQVLNIVYLGGAAANFGFFPNRLNGAIR